MQLYYYPSLVETQNARGGDAVVLFFPTISILRYLDIFEYKMPTNVHLPNLLLRHFTSSIKIAQELE